METVRTKVVKEGVTSFLVPEAGSWSNQGPGTKTRVGFYNPSMEMNRDISVLVVQWFVDTMKKPLKILDGLAASGARGVRFANEVEGDFCVTINDWNKNAAELITKNIEQNKLNNAVARCEDFNHLLCDERFHYIDIDPFGTPVPYMDAAVKGVVSEGILAVTATDTATLCGVYPKTCLRRYGAVPLRSWVKHEVGLRILVGFICRETAKYDHGINVLLSYTTDHYMRVYVRVSRGAKKADNSLEQVQRVEASDFMAHKKNKVTEIGPLWMGKLHNKNMLLKLRDILQRKACGTRRGIEKLLERMIEEVDLPPFFYTVDSVSSQLKISPPKLVFVLTALNEKGFMAGRTQFDDAAFKTDASKEEVCRVIKELASYKFRK